MLYTTPILKRLAEQASVSERVHVVLYTEHGRAEATLALENWRDTLTVLLDQCESEGATVRAWSARSTRRLRNRFDGEGEGEWAAPGWVVTPTRAMPQGYTDIWPTAAGPVHFVGPESGCPCVGCRQARAEIERMRNMR